MASECIRALKTLGISPDIEILNDITEHPAFDKAAAQSGAALAVWAETDMGCRIGADMAGAIKRPAEYIGKTVARQLIEDIDSGAVTDRYLADQLVPFAALADGLSEYRIPEITDHVEARTWLTENLLGAKTEWVGNLLKIKGINYHI